MKKYLPEGCIMNSPENEKAISSEYAMQEALSSGAILEARVSVCDNEHNLIVDLPCMKGIIPRVEGAIGIDSGATRDIALISKVNKPVCFKVLSIRKDKYGNNEAILSRRAVQEECYNNYIINFKPGDIIPAKVTHLEQFGCFVDIGCGIPSLIPIDTISVSRISHPSDRFYTGQDIKVIVKGMENDKILLSHKELLGTWEENAEMFNVGETVSGIVRSIEDYGIFIELSPNLAGLAEPRKDTRIGQNASVYIKSIIPDKMKVKLIIVDVFNAEYKHNPIKYFVNDNHISYWKYTPDSSNKIIDSFF